jgi:hypothetical protein
LLFALDSDADTDTRLKEFKLTASEKKSIEDLVLKIDNPDQKHTFNMLTQRI